MMKTMKVLLLSMAVGGIAAPASVYAARNDSVSCTVSISYSLNGVLTESYQQAFVIDPNLPFSDDFSTPTRFKFFDASTHRVSGASIVDLSYFSDVGVFDSVELNTVLTLRDGRASETISGSSTHYATSGSTHAHTTSYSATCERVR